MAKTTEDIINSQREKIQKLVTELVKAYTSLLKEYSHDRLPESEKGVDEQLANMNLAYRHLEDARMRLGKVLQARNGGVSIYDKQ